MNKHKLGWSHITIGVSLTFCLLLFVNVFGAENKPDEGTQGRQQAKQLEFELKEASVFELGEEIRSDFVRGQYAQCQEERLGQIKAYPAFKSNKPLFGEVYFSGKNVKGDSQSRYCFTIDESAGTGKGYDTLYFDQDGDLDLTNDTKLMANPNPPSGALLKYSSVKQQVCFDKLNIKFAFGSVGEQTVELVPR